MPAVDQTIIDKDLKLLADAGCEAGRIAMRYFRKKPEVWMKDGRSPVSEADLAVDRFLHEELMAARPEYGWLSEEVAGSAGFPGNEYMFVVDPIDGTRAFLEGRPFWCVSIAIITRGRPVAGILDCPARTEVFSASRGGGASVNGQTVKVSGLSDRPRVGGPMKMIDALPPEFRRTVEPQPYVPSLAYRLAMVARGDIDATYVKPNSHDWDLAAADLMIEEAGGAIRTGTGETPIYGKSGARHGALVAGSGELLNQLQKHLAA